MLPEKEMIGKKFNRLTVIERVEDQIIRTTGQHCAMYKCLCDCGNYTNVRESNLLHNGVKSCGCITRELVRSRGKIKASDIIGKRFGRLIVKEWLGTTGGQSRYRCVCDCGTETNVWRGSLIKGGTQSCGCLARERASDIARITGYKNSANLVGMKIGRLTVIEKVGSQCNNVIWKCKCECGSVVEYSSARLLSHGVQSCGCLISKGEEMIGKYLTEHDIPYKKQKSFVDCRDDKPLPFDFWIESKNVLIEFDGEQHFKDNAFFHHTLEYVQKHDEIKNKYCDEHDIKLIRIPYTDIDYIDEYLKEVI